jgi:uncharacterized protein YndB with AHSA1/START domain
MEPGAEIEWAWPDGERETVHVDDVQPGQRIVFRWRAHRVPSMTRVEIDLREEGDQTVVTISESGWEADEAGLKSSCEHCAGWQHMLLCMKNWLVRGIDIRG